MRRFDPFLLSVVLCWLASTFGALDRDPYLAQPRVAIVLPLPSRWPLQAVIAAGMGLGLALLLLPNRPHSRARPIGAVALTLLTILLLLLATPFVRPRNHFAGVVLNLAQLVSLALYLLWSRRSELLERPRSTKLENVMTMGVTLALVVLVGEGIASLRTASHAVGYTLASRAWFSRHWNPRNSEGYRDSEKAGAPGRRIDVLGDSFVAGVGIANIDDRMSNILDRRLAPGFRVHNLGVNGSNTRDELRRFVTRPTPPDLLILSYYANDIQEACEEVGHRLPAFAPYSNLPLAIAALVRRSYLLDDLYWRFPQSDLAPYEGMLESCYRDPRALRLHLQDLGGFITYSRQREVPLLVVAFPHLVRSEPTRRLIGPVIDYFRQRAITVVDVFPLLEGLEQRERTVNRNDAHPSIRLNGIVAEAVLGALESGGLLQPVRSR